METKYGKEKCFCIGAEEAKTERKRNNEIFRVFCNRPDMVWAPHATSFFFRGGGRGGGTRLGLVISAGVRTGTTPARHPRGSNPRPGEPQGHLGARGARSHIFLIPFEMPRFGMVIPHGMDYPFRTFVYLF